MREEVTVNEEEREEKENNFRSDTRERRVKKYGRKNNSKNR